MTFTRINLPDTFLFEGKFFSLGGEMNQQKRSSTKVCGAKSTNTLRLKALLIFTKKEII